MSDNKVNGPEDTVVVWSTIFWASLDVKDGIR